MKKHSLADLVANTSAGLLSICKCLLKSRRPTLPKGDGKDRPMIILANGPSLRETLDQRLDDLRKFDTLTVNFAPNTPDFTNIKPNYHLLADPHFFEGREKDPNVGRLWENLGNVDWEMTLLVPVGRSGSLPLLPGCVSAKTFNMTPAEGSDSIIFPLFDLGVATPRPRNVLIPSLMAAIRLGYTTIYIAGADHTVSKTLSVDDQNRVVSIQPHFYADSKKELDRVATEYAGYHLHDILNSLTIAFRSYHVVRAYADSRHVRIINATPGSMIDAFERGQF